MKTVTQQGFSLPETLVTLAMVSLTIGLIGSFAGARIETEKIHAKRADGRHIASLAVHAYRSGLLTGDAATAVDLQAALPHLVIPTRLGDGQTYRIALDGDDPRILIGGGTEVVRAPFPASELRIPLWRARQLRQTQVKTE